LVRRFIALHASWFDCPALRLEILIQLLGVRQRLLTQSEESARVESAVAVKLNLATVLTM